MSMFKYEYVPIEKLKESEKSFKLLKSGKYKFEVVNAETVPNKTSGGEQLKLTLKGTDEEGRVGSIFDYIQPSLAWKIKGFLDSIGKIEWYGRGFETQSLIGKRGEAVIKVQNYVNNHGESSDKNNISYYIDRDKQDSFSLTNSTNFKGNIENAKKSLEEIDDDLPF